MSPIFQVSYELFLVTDLNSKKNPQGNPKWIKATQNPSWSPAAISHKVLDK